MRRWIVAALALCAAVAIATPPAFALGASGEAVVVDVNGKALAGGATKTEFTIQLPKGASCQKDSQDGGYRVQSFMIPAANDPGSLTYHFDAPDGDGSQPLWDIYTNPFMQGLTGVATAKGGEGPVVNLPLFSLAVYTPRLDLLPSGHYVTGIACTHYNKTTRFWSTEIDVTTDATKPENEQIRWSVVASATPSSRASSSSSGAVAAAVVTLLVIGAALAFGRRRRRSSS